MIQVPPELWIYDEYYPGRVEEAERQGKVVSVKVTYLFDNTVFTAGDIQEEGISIVTQINNGNVAKVGCAYSTETTFTLLKSTKTDNTNLYGSFKIEFGLDIDNYGTLWINKGYFIPIEVVDNSVTGTISIHALDKMILFDIDASNVLNNISFPCSMFDIVDKVCDYVGVTTSHSGISNYTFNNAIDFSLYNIGSCRDIIAYVAEFYGTNAKIDYDGKLSFSHEYPTPITGVYTSDDLYSAELTGMSNSYQKIKWQDVSSMKWSDMAVFKYSVFSNIPYRYSTNLIVKTKDGRTIGYDNSLDTIPYYIINNPFFDSLSDADILSRAYSVIFWLSLTDFNNVVSYSSNIGILFEPMDIIVPMTYGLMPIYSINLQWNGSITLSFESPKDYVKDERNEA